MSEIRKPWPERLEIQPLPGPCDADVTVPGSKSLTNRALLLAALAARDGDCQLRGCLDSEDVQVMLDSLGRLGFSVEAAGTTLTVRQTRDERIIPASSADLFVGNSGTTMRFLTAAACLGQGRFRLDGVARMRERPLGDLLQALRQLGVRIRCEGKEGFPPVLIEAADLPGGSVTLRGDVSSQFLSGLLMAAPLATGEVQVRIEGPLVSRPYVAMTLAMMRQFGARVEEREPGTFVVPGEQRYRKAVHAIEPDASAASYFLAAAAITGGRVRVRGLTAQSLQGDIAFAEVLRQMGCQVQQDASGIEVRGGPLQGVDVNMNAISDTVMTLAAVALFAQGPTTIRDVAHVRHKETDRLSALATELRRLGAEVEERLDGLTIQPRPLHGAAVETYDDHRMAMSLAIVGLRQPGVTILNPACVAKTYPGFFDDLARLNRRPS